MSAAPWDIAVVGGGIVGLATARELIAREPGRRILLLEKEPLLAQHQTGRNSGVVHSGLYYRPDSAKARLCVDGGRRLVRFCRAHDLPLRTVGKVVVASDESELAALEELQRRGEVNGVEGLALVDARGLRAIEPHAVGVAAVHVPGVSVVDYGEVARVLGSEARRLGVEILTGGIFLGARKDERGWRMRVTLGGKESELCAQRLVTCAGLHSDRVARSSGARPQLRIVPFRGEYFTLRKSAAKLVRGLIYPVPDPRFPFLGVHFTRRVGGEVDCGPNAVPALAREGYRPSSFDMRDFNLRDVASSLLWPGAWRLGLRHARVGLGEIRRSWDRAAFARALQRLVPAVQVGDLVAARPGVRAQAVDRDGALLDDFEILSQEGATHVLNAPSPAATAALAIAVEIAERVEADEF